MMNPHGDDATPRSGVITLRNGVKIDFAEITKINEENQRNPERLARIARLREVVARGAPNIAVLDTPLAEGALAEIIFAPNSGDDRTIAIGADRLTDETLIRARHALFVREMEQGSKRVQERLTLWADGRLRVRRGKHVEERRVDVEVQNPSHSGAASRLMKEVQRAEYRRLSDLGAARVYKGGR